MAVRKLYFYQEILIKEYNGIAVGTTIVFIAICIIIIENVTKPFGEQRNDKRRQL